VINAPSNYKIEALDPKTHARAAFDCGVEPLNRYLQEQARLDVKRLAAGCWVLVDAAQPKTILGYYTLSPESALSSELLANLPPEAAKKFPRYPRLGAYLIGRLAVHKAHQGQNLGRLLLLDALHRCALNPVPCVVVLVDPNDTAAEAFYARYGFRRLNDERMFLPTAEIMAWLPSD
jgi:ribosomal protein S18 acetylase RimI-like enzyme